MNHPKTGNRVRAAGLAVAAALGCLAGCAVGPDFHAPTPPDTPAYTAHPLPEATEGIAIEGGEAQHFHLGDDPPHAWWSLFHSPELDALMSRALARYPEIAAQQAALRQARENVRAQQGLFAPAVQGTSTQERAEISGASISPGFPSFTTNIFQAAVNVSYTLDLFGGERRALEGARAQLDYQARQLEASELALTASIASGAIGLAATREQISVTHQIIEVEEQELHVVERLYEAGVRTRADLLQQQSSLAAIKASLPALEQQAEVYEHALATLTGQLPHDADPIRSRLADLELPRDIPVSLPSSLVAQRPDIQAHVAQMHQASAAIGVATANLLPQLTLTGSLGDESLQWSSLLQPGSGIWSMTSGVTQPLFSGGSLHAKRRAAVAAFDQARAQYQLAVLNAFQN